MERLNVNNSFKFDNRSIHSNNRVKWIILNVKFAMLCDCNTISIVTHILPINYLPYNHISKSILFKISKIQISNIYNFVLVPGHVVIK